MPGGWPSSRRRAAACPNAEAYTGVPGAAGRRRATRAAATAADHDSPADDASATAPDPRALDPDARARGAHERGAGDDGADRDSLRCARVGRCARRCSLVAGVVRSPTSCCSRSRSLARRALPAPAGHGTPIERIELAWTEAVEEAALVGFAEVPQRHVSPSGRERLAGGRSRGARRRRRVQARPGAPSRPTYSAEGAPTTTPPSAPPAARPPSPCEGRQPPALRVGRWLDPRPILRGCATSALAPAPHHAHGPRRPRAGAGARGQRATAAEGRRLALARRRRGGSARAIRPRPRRGRRAARWPSSSG